MQSIRELAAERDRLEQELEERVSPWVEAAYLRGLFHDLSSSTSGVQVEWVAWREAEEAVVIAVSTEYPEEQVAYVVPEALASETAIEADLEERLGRRPSERLLLRSLPLAPLRLV